MEELRVHIWHVMWEFKNNKNAAETAKKNSCIYDQGIITDCQVCKWFSKFHSGNIMLRNEPRSRYFKRISGMQSAQKYIRISTKPQHILNIQ